LFEGDHMSSPGHGRVAWRLISATLCICWVARGVAAEPATDSPARRGEQALLGRAFSPLAWRASAYERLWQQWAEDGDKPPADYDRAIRERYGLHVAPYDNGSYPMGLRESTFLGIRGLTKDCLLCHGGSIAGHSYVGLGNASLDLQGLFEDLN